MRTIAQNAIFPFSLVFNRYKSLDPDGSTKECSVNKVFLTEWSALGYPGLRDWTLGSAVVSHSVFVGMM
jgi:hypothetical protein